MNTAKLKKKLFCCIGVILLNFVDPIKDVKDIIRVKEYLKKSNSRDYLLFVIGINTGMRVSKLLTLKYSDLIIDGKFVDTIRDGKVEYQINQIVRESITNQNFNIYNSDFDLNVFLFRSRKGNVAIDRSHAYRILNNVALEVKLPYKIGMLSLRKTFGYHHYLKNRDIKYLQKLFQHTSVKQTMNYIGIEEELIIKNENEQFSL